MKNKILKYSSFLLLLFTFCGCSVFANNLAPYQISGKMVIDSSGNYESAGLEFRFFNKSEKNVKDFTIVFFLFDDDGNPPLSGKNNIVIKINEFVDRMDYLESTVSIDKYLTLIPNEPYSVDFLYVSQINYEDGSQWNDPFGLESL